MSELKCPFCNGKLEQVFIHGIQSWACTNLECKGYFMTATKDMWQELIRTRKALGIAVDALNRIDKQLMTGIEMTSQARNALEQITTLEQKE